MIPRILLVSAGVVAIVAGVFILAGQVNAPTIDSVDLSAALTATVPADTREATTPDTATEEPAVVVVDTPTVEPTLVAEIASPLATPTAESQKQSPLARPGVGAPVYTYEVLAEYPHDPAAFTQGLVYTDGVLYEGTGLYGRSGLRKVDLATGVPFQIVSLPDEYFGEGITVFDDKVYQLTWKSRQGFIYDADDFSSLSTFQYPTEGWGLTHDGEQLIMSDGSATLYWRDPETFEETKRVMVQDNGAPVVRLNELEYVNGEILANVWQTNWIARIDPDTGKVVGWIDLTGLLKPVDREMRVDVLNGIAYDAEEDRLFVTGKLWPKLFEIELMPAE